MKKTNKGFSMVELIIVIAIMAILAGALAPSLIKYINKSRLSTDIQTGQTVASAITTALSNESCYNDADDTDEAMALSEFLSEDNNFTREVKSVLGIADGDEVADKIAVKSKQDMDGVDLDDDEFYVEMKKVDNEIIVYAGDTDHQVYPSPVTSMSEKSDDKAE